MKERILEILKHTGLTATRLADEIGVQRSGISHIISGRNQPSFDFMVKLLDRFDEISADWLLTGKGNMIRGNTEPNHDAAKESTPGTLPSPQKIIADNKKIITDKEVTNVTHVSKVILLRSDGTFEAYRNSENE